MLRSIIKKKNYVISYSSPPPPPYLFVSTFLQQTKCYGDGGDKRRSAVASLFLLISIFP